MARLDLVRTLRDLGLDLATIRQIVDREISLPEVVAAVTAEFGRHLSSPDDGDLRRGPQAPR